MKQLEKYDGDPTRDLKGKKVEGQRHDRGTASRAVVTRRSETTSAEVVETPVTDSPPIQANLLPPSTAIMKVNSIESTSPPRGMMLTSQGEVDERLTKMKEAFLKSLEGFDSGNGNDTRRKDKDKEKGPLASNSTSKTALPFPRSTSNSPLHSGFSSSDDVHPLASHGMTLGFTSREQRLDRTRYNIYVPGLESHRPRYSSASSSTLGHSDIVGTSQGSEEVIGRMDLYEERRRGAFPG